jgi:hypothetical protein
MARGRELVLGLVHCNAQWVDPEELRAGITPQPEREVNVWDFTNLCLSRFEG